LDFGKLTQKLNAVEAERKRRRVEHSWKSRSHVGDLSTRKIRKDEAGGAKSTEKEIKKPSDNLKNTNDTSSKQAGEESPVWYLRVENILNNHKESKKPARSEQAGEKTQSKSPMKIPSKVDPAETQQSEEFQKEFRALVNMVDANADNVINFDEFKKVYPIATGVFFGMLDVNNDGVLSIQEFRELFKTSDKGYDLAKLQNVKRRVERNMKKSKSAENAMVKKEVVSPQKEDPEPTFSIEDQIVIDSAEDQQELSGDDARFEKSFMELVRLVDVNADEQISFSEFKTVHPIATGVFFAMLDINGDGILQIEEFRNNFISSNGAYNFKKLEEVHERVEKSIKKNPPRVRRQNSMSKQLASHDFASKPKPSPTMQRQNSMSKQLVSHDFASKPVSVSVLSDSESISIIPDPKSAPGASDPQLATVSDALDQEDIIFNQEFEELVHLVDADADKEITLDEFKKVYPIATNVFFSILDFDRNGILDVGEFRMMFFQENGDYDFERLREVRARVESSMHNKQLNLNAFLKSERDSESQLERRSASRSRNRSPSGENLDSMLESGSLLAQSSMMESIVEEGLDNEIIQEKKKHKKNNSSVPQFLPGSDMILQEIDDENDMKAAEQNQQMSEMLEMKQKLQEQERLIAEFRSKQQEDDRNLKQHQEEAERLRLEAENTKRQQEEARKVKELEMAKKLEEEEAAKKLEEQKAKQLEAEKKLEEERAAKEHDEQQRKLKEQERKEEIQEALADAEQMGVVDFEEVEIEVEDEIVSRPRKKSVTLNIPDEPEPEVSQKEESPKAAHGKSPNSSVHVKREVGRSERKSSRKPNMRNHTNSMHLDNAVDKEMDAQVEAKKRELTALNEKLEALKSEISIAQEEREFLQEEEQNSGGDKVDDSEDIVDIDEPPAQQQEEPEKESTSNDEIAIQQGESMNTWDDVVRSSREVLQQTEENTKQELTHESPAKEQKSARLRRQTSKVAIMLANLESQINDEYKSMHIAPATTEEEMARDQRARSIIERYTNTQTDVTNQSSSERKRRTSLAEGIIAKHLGAMDTVLPAPDSSKADAQEQSSSVPRSKSPESPKVNAQRKRAQKQLDIRETVSLTEQLHQKRQVSKYQSEKRRCLAVISSQKNQVALSKFVQKNAETLKYFRITGSRTVMKVVQHVFQDDPNVIYGPTTSHLSMGGAAQISAQLMLEDIGGLLLFSDPVTPKNSDIQSLLRLADIHNLLVATNPSSAEAISCLLKLGVEDAQLIPSFHQTIENPWLQTRSEGPVYE